MLGFWKFCQSRIVYAQVNFKDIAIFSANLKIVFFETDFICQVSLAVVKTHIATEKVCAWKTWDLGTLH